MTEKQILTRESYDRLQAELDDLKINKRKYIADKIKEAREQGDLSENAEYDAAKDEQRDIEARIEELEITLKNSEVQDENSINFNKIHIGCVVELQNIATKEKVKYEIVDISSVNALEKKISDKSPIGKALMDKEVGNIVEVQIPAGTIKYKVLKINKAD